MRHALLKACALSLLGMTLASPLAARCTDMTGYLLETASWDGGKLTVTLENPAEAVAAIGLCFQSLGGDFDQCSVVHDVYIARNNPAAFSSDMTTGRYRFAAQFDFGCEADIIADFGLDLPGRGNESYTPQPD